MSQKRQWSIVVLITVFAFCAVGEAVSTKQIDAVRQKAVLNKEVLETADFEEIDVFWAEALGELLILDDFSEIVNIRNQIFARRGGSEAGQYTVGFITSGQKHLTTAFDEVQNWETGERKTWTERNLIILTAQLESAKLVELGMRMIGHHDSTVRYWAVKALTNQDVVRQLNANASVPGEPAAGIMRQLEITSEKETHPEILSLIASFAGQVNGAGAKQLLSKIVDLRISAYEKWTVKYELMDANLLRSLGNEILSQSSQPNKAANSRRFAQLYSYAMQRFILGAKVLGDVSKQQLASVLVEVEQSILDRLLGRPQSSIKKAVEKILTKRSVGQKDYSALEAEHDSLLGSVSRQGELAAALDFDYGKKPDGSAITAPKRLCPPPEETPESEAEEAGNEIASPESEAGAREGEDAGSGSEAAEASG